MAENKCFLSVCNGAFGEGTCTAKEHEKEACKTYTDGVREMSERVKLNALPKKPLKELVRQSLEACLRLK